MLFVKAISLLYLHALIGAISATFYTTYNPIGGNSCFLDNPKEMYNGVSVGQCTSACNILDNCSFLSHIVNEIASRTGSCLLYTTEPHFYRLVDGCQSYQVTMAGVNCRGFLVT
jgi:hypothetical protein